MTTDHNRIESAPESPNGTLAERVDSFDWASNTTIPRGHALALTTRDRPVRTARGWSKAPLRHGISTVRTGRRHALGLIFHGAT